MNLLPGLSNGHGVLAGLEKINKMPVFSKISRVCSSPSCVTIKATKKSLTMQDFNTRNYASHLIIVTDKIQIGKIAEFIN